MDASDGTDLYSREAYTHRYRDRLRHQQEKKQETTKVWVLSLPQHRLDLRCHSIDSVKVDEFFHSTLYFQWCVRRFKKSLTSLFGEGESDWATLIFEHMMAASERHPFEAYNLTDQQILTDAKEVFGVIGETLAFPSMNSNGMLQFGKVAHDHMNQDDDHSNGMKCWAHRINRDADTIFETCRNEGLQFQSLPTGVSERNCLSQNSGADLEQGDQCHTHNPAPPLETEEKATTSGAEGSQKEPSPLFHHIVISPDMKNPEICKQTDKKRDELGGERRNILPENVGMGRAGETSQEMGSPGLKDVAMTVMGFKEACREISTAIEEGAPTYNKGDHKGCYEIYRQTAEKILQHCSVGGVQQELRVALDLAAKQSTFTIQAWTMRHAFDAIVSGDIDTSDLTDSDLEEVSPPHCSMSASRKNMTYKDACREIAAAISVGAPTYNKGDHTGCYNIYRQTAEKIVENCSVSVVQLELQTALELAAKQTSFTDRAWTMRHAFDTILRGVTETTDEENGEPGITYKDVCREISLAISKGAPAYNRGDHGGCYNIYKQTAEKILEQCSIKSVQRELRSALDTVTRQSSSTMRAWTIRHAFDAILRGHCNDDSELVGSARLSRDDPTITLFSHLLGRRGTL